MKLHILCLSIYTLWSTTDAIVPTINNTDVIMPPTPTINVVANLQVRITGDEHLFWLDGSGSSGDIGSYLWELVVGDGADFTTDKVEFPYWPQKGGFYKWKLTICDTVKCSSTSVETKIKKFKRCQSRYQGVMWGISHHIPEDRRSNDLFPPECTKNGLFKRLQCVFWPYEYCECVDRRTGRNLFGDFHFLPSAGFRCKRAPRPCEMVVLPGNVNRVLGLPTCNRRGWYKRKQCSKINTDQGNQDQCWCVTKTGEEIDGTRTLSGERLNCSRPPKECEKLRREALLGINPLYIPNCKRNGNYKKKQCRINQIMERECFCVFQSTGEEVPNTIGDENIRC